jgi:hypothetical protein
MRSSTFDYSHSSLNKSFLEVSFSSGIVYATAKKKQLLLSRGLPVGNLTMSQKFNYIVNCSQDFMFPKAVLPAKISS